MCGIIGVVGHNHVNHYIFDALSLLQHRGQDAGGIATLHKNKFYLHKDIGMVNDIFNTDVLASLLGKVGIGHVRYPTAGNPGASESQPFYVNSPCGMMFAHNGNITNTKHLKKMLQEKGHRHINTESDSEILLNILAEGIQQNQNNSKNDRPTPQDVFSGVKFLNSTALGGYACVAVIAELGLLAFRDPKGIRPLVLGKQETENGTLYMVASESVALDISGFERVRDVAPGEAIVITEDGALHSAMCADNTSLNPCLFEYIYFARPDSIMDDISVYQCRVNTGKKLAMYIKEKWGDKQIDAVIPIPETGRTTAQEIAKTLNVEYREGFVKNRYVGRTFIMPSAEGRQNSVRRKLNPIPTEFYGKNILLVDDSIVRGTTSKKIIEMVKGLGAKNVYMASASPEVKFPNVYGIDMPTRNELLAHNRTLKEIRQWIGVDDLIYLDIADLQSTIKELNPNVSGFENSVFTGQYITGDVDEKYLQELEASMEKVKNAEAKHRAFLADNVMAKF